MGKGNGGLRSHRWGRLAFERSFQPCSVLARQKERTGVFKEQSSSGRQCLPGAHVWHVLKTAQQVCVGRKIETVPALAAGYMAGLGQRGLGRRGQGCGRRGRCQRWPVWAAPGKCELLWSRTSARKHWAEDQARCQRLWVPAGCVPESRPEAAAACVWPFLRAGPAPDRIDPSLLGTQPDQRSQGELALGTRHSLPQLGQGLRWAEKQSRSAGLFLSLD